ncbi:MAG: hypothetical protein KDA22_10540 [Phycisphaerales bacterium]|nr:hypothetical protein [Phycisphaerales bacterium]
MTQTPHDGGPGEHQPPRIIHTGPGFGSHAAPGSEPGSPASDSGAPTAEASTPQIRHFGNRTRHEETWSRTPNTTGTGAIHVKTFHTKLTDEALTYLDQTINEWLDAHPQYEVKFVTSTIGEFTGKLREPHVICQVWV